MHDPSTTSRTVTGELARLVSRDAAQQVSSERVFGAVTSEPGRSLNSLDRPPRPGKVIDRWRVDGAELEDPVPANPTTVPILTDDAAMAARLLLKAARGASAPKAGEYTAAAERFTAALQGPHRAR